HVFTPALPYFCAVEKVFDSIDATVSADGNSWTGTGSLSVNGATRCAGFFVTVTGTRCGGGTLDPGEQCDDGNITNGDGCSAHCQIQPPTTPTPSPLCGPAPRAGCRSAPSGALIIRQGEQPANNSLVWKWLRGATDASELGDPVGGATSYALCIYGTTA